MKRHGYEIVSLLLTAGLAVGSSSVLAQSPETPAPGTEDAAPAADPASTAGAAPGEPFEQIDEILEEDEEVLAGGGYSYDPAGRRDPFLSLLRRISGPELPQERPEGVPGLLIDEVDIKGIFDLSGRVFAQVQTADKEKSYIIQVGDQLYDGEVITIDRNEVAFKQIINDPSIIKPFREVVKKLNPVP